MFKKLTSAIGRKRKESPPPSAAPMLFSEPDSDAPANNETTPTLLALSPTRPARDTISPPPVAPAANPERPLSVTPPLSSLSQRLDDQLKRLSRVVAGTNTRQLQLVDQLQALAEVHAAAPKSFELPPRLVEALERLPSAIEANSELPARTLQALDRIELLTSTIRSHQQLQRRAADDLTGMRADLSKFLGTVTTAVTELTELHRTVLSQVSVMADQQREVFRSHRSQLIEFEQIRDATRHELAEEHRLREHQHERRMRTHARRISVAVTVLCLTTLFCALISGGVLNFRAAQYHSPQQAIGAPENEPNGVGNPMVNGEGPPRPGAVGDAFVSRS